MTTSTLAPEAGHGRDLDHRSPSCVREPASFSGRLTTEVTMSDHYRSSLRGPCLLVELWEAAWIALIVGVLTLMRSRN